MLAAYKTELMGTLGADAEPTAASYACTAQSCAGTTDSTTTLYKKLQQALNACAKILERSTITEDGAIGPSTAKLAITMAQTMDDNFLASKGLSWLAKLDTAKATDTGSAFTTLAAEPVKYTAAFVEYATLAAKQMAEYETYLAARRRKRVLFGALGAVAVLGGAGAGVYFYKRHRAHSSAI